MERLSITNLIRRKLQLRMSAISVSISCFCSEVSGRNGRRGKPPKYPFTSIEYFTPGTPNSPTTRWDGFAMRSCFSLPKACLLPSTLRKFHSRRLERDMRKLISLLLRQRRAMARVDARHPPGLGIRLLSVASLFPQSRSRLTMRAAALAWRSDPHLPNLPEHRPGSIPHFGS